MFFDENMGFISLNTDFISPNLFNSNQGFIHGNMFEDDYVGYKNYEVKTPKAKTEKEAYLYKIMELEFSINDLNLFLDLNPNNEKIYNLIKDYIGELLEIKNEFITKYGPLEICDLNKTNYNWVNDWPWDKEDGMYV